jgi:hypothetical protein
MEMAKEAEFELDCVSLEWHKRIEAFAKLVREDEREACAVIADGQLRNTNALLTYPPQSSAAYQIGVAIRARGNT